MPDLPDKEFKPEDVDKVIRHYRQPLGAERKQALMKKLEAERGRFVERKQETSQDQKQDQGRSR